MPAWVEDFLFVLLLPAVTAAVFFVLKSFNGLLFFFLSTSVESVLMFKMSDDIHHSMNDVRAIYVSNVNGGKWSVGGW